MVKQIKESEGHQQQNLQPQVGLPWHILPPAPQPQQPKKQKLQSIGEGRWIKPVDSPHVEAQWYPKTSNASTTTWVQIANPPKLIHESSDEDEGLIEGFDIAYFFSFDLCHFIYFNKGSFYFYFQFKKF